MSALANNNEKDVPKKEDATLPYLLAQAEDVATDAETEDDEDFSCTRQTNWQNSQAAKVCGFSDLPAYSHRQEQSQSTPGLPYNRCMATAPSALHMGPPQVVASTKYNFDYPVLPYPPPPAGYPSTSSVNYASCQSFQSQGQYLAQIHGQYSNGGGSKHKISPFEGKMWYPNAPYGHEAQAAPSSSREYFSSYGVPRNMHYDPALYAQEPMMDMLQLL